MGQDGRLLRSLSGAGWELKGYLGEDWRWRNAEKPSTRDVLGWLPAVVPGCPQDDLLDAGQIPDPYFERNSLLLEWIPERTWLYRKRFRLEPSERRPRVQLRFEGIDASGTVYLNGEPLGTHAGTYVPVSFEVADRLRWGEENQITVVLDPAPECEPQVGRTEKVRIHKSRMGYGWDFCPRMIHLGIWDDVLLVGTGGLRIEDVFVRPMLSEDFRSARVRVAVQSSAVRSGGGRLEVAILEDGQPVARTDARCEVVSGPSWQEVEVGLEAPRLWWPNGEGAQPLYVAQIRLYDAEGALSDSRTIPFGVRRVEFAPNPSADPCARPYTLVVNGKKLYARGWNWCPLDVLYGRHRPEKLARMLTLAARARVNLLRVWGGGLIERRDFYERCDALGLMVWQEFAQSSSGISSKTSEEPEFVHRMEEEARAIVPRRRNHPSLVLWCGGNELQSVDGKPLDDRDPVLAALKRVVGELDPDRGWLPTSPSGRVFGNTLQSIEADPEGLHDVHGPWEHQGPSNQYRLYDLGTSLLNSEFGVEGFANRAALERLVAPEHRWPPGRENPVLFHLGAWWNNAPQVRGWFGGIDELEPLRRASQFLQADGLRYAIEANRRRQPRNSGTLPWQFNESYPNATCTAAVDYWAQPKPAYFAVARAYAPVLPCARLQKQVLGGEQELLAALWAVTENALEGVRLHATLWTASGNSRGEQIWEGSVAAGATQLRTAVWPLEGVPESGPEAVLLLRLELRDAAGHGLSRNEYVLSRGSDLSPLLRVPSTRLAARCEREGAAVRAVVRNEGPAAALQVELVPTAWPSEAFVEDSGFALLPGEERAVRLRWADDAPAPRPGFRLESWNSEPVELVL